MKPTRFYGVVLLTGLTLACYVNSLPNAFVWDDELLVVENSHIRNSLYLPAMFTTDLFHRYDELVATHYRPMQTISYMLDYTLWGLNPLGYHLTNILLHLVCALLVWGLVEKLSGVRWLALVVAALFAVHPVNTNAVAYVAGRADPMAFAFMLGALLLYIEYWTRPERSPLARAGLFAASMVCFAGALFSRENALLLPLLVLAYCVTLGAPLKDKWSNGFLATASFAVIAVLFATWRSVVLDIQGKPLDVDWPMSLRLRVQTVFCSLATYLGLLVWPAHLQMQRPLMVDGPWTHVLTAIGLCAAAAIGTFARWARRSSALALFGLCWFVITLLPLTGALSLNASIAEHWLYVPSVGLYLAVGATIFQLRGRWPALQHPVAVRIAAAVCVIAVAALSARTVRRNQDWATPMSLHSQTRLAAPNSAGVRCNLGRAYVDAGQVDKAIEELLAAERLAPRYTRVKSNLAAYYLASGNINEALRKAEEATRLDPANTGALLQLATICEQQGRLGEARRHYIHAVATTTDIQPRLHYSKFLLKQRDFKAALNMANEMYALEPGNADVFNLLGAVLSEIHQYDKAEEAFQMARALDRHCSDADVNLGRLAIVRGDLAAAEASYESALRIQPDDVRALYQLGLIHWRRDQRNLAIEKLSAALTLAPSSTTIREALIRVRSGGQFEKITLTPPPTANTAG